MQRMLDFIEATLDAEITPEELAERSGYSLWHFMELFRSQVGMPLCRYRTRRRLAHAIWHVSQGVNVTDAALRWGFESHSGFYRAFRREHGMSPTAYLRSNRVRRPTVPRLTEEEYRMLTRERFQEALMHWGLSLPLAPVHHPSSGYTSETAMYAGEDHVLKAYRDEHQCRLAIAMAEALTAQGIPAGRAIPLPEGDMFVRVCGMPVTLCRRVQGEGLRAERLLAVPAEGRRIGAALAKLHLALADMAEDAETDGLDVATHLLDWALPATAEQLPEGFPADYAKQAAALRTLPQGLIHRDPNPGNMMDAPSGIGFVDFELSVRSVRLFDPCYAMTAVLSETYGRSDCPWETAWPVFCREVMAGYDSVSPLTEAEWATIPTLLLGNELLCLAAFADSSKYREVFQTNRAMLAWMVKHLPVAKGKPSAEDQG